MQDHGEWDAFVGPGGAALERPHGGQPDALIGADASTWSAIARDLRGGMEAFRSGRLSLRRNLNLGIGFLAATSGDRGNGRLVVRRVETGAGALSTLQAGSGEPVVALHGLGGTKASFLPTLTALAPGYRVVAVDLPGFGDSAKPIGAPYHAAFFARSVVALLDALGLERAHLLGNSMGGRVAIEVGLRAPERSGRIALLSPSLAWLRARRWAPMLRLLRPELGLVQAAPRPVVERIARRLVPGADNGWVAVGVDEFLRAYLKPRGRAAFYAAARQIYLEEPYGEKGFWNRLATLAPEVMFVWGRQDQLVPIAFARHVERALPAARHVELDCGHVPQLEKPAETHDAVRDFLAP
ncbi:MAG TPA: alpha/beta fold hydrolase [Thermoleophilaceae bacterium]|nr:alpha/beta fold hydrolase [Thermoleophilaceae bacterium]